MLQIRKVVYEGGIIPPWYGLAWYDFYRRAAVCYPMPFNVVARLLLGVWVWVKHGHKEVSSDSRDAYAQGYREGLVAGRESCDD